MSHDLHYNEQTQRHSFVSAKEVPWHKLGQIVDHTMTAEEAICEADLCFDVEKRPILRDDNIPLENWMETRRMDTGTTLGLVGKNYMVIQNKDCFTFFDQIVGEGKAIFETAGALKKGEQVFITAKLPDEIVVAKDDIIQNYIALVTSHDMSLALTAFFTPVRIVCNNTLNAALRDNLNRVYLRHTSGIKEQMWEAARIMGLNSKYLDNLGLTFNELAEKPITDKEMEKMIGEVFLNNEEKKAMLMDGDAEISTRKANTIRSVIEYYLGDPTMDTIRGTKYGVYNAITGYFQNVKEYSSDDLKMKNIVLHGTAYKYAQKAFNMLIKQN